MTTRTRLLRKHGVYLAAVFALAGCGPEEVRPPGDAAAARATLTQVLDAWKAGKTADELRTGDPVIYASDSDWAAGRRLAGYELVDEPVQNGGEWRVFALVTLAGERGKASSSKVCYSVTPGSPASVIRSDYLY